MPSISASQVNKAGKGAALFGADFSRDSVKQWHRGSKARDRTESQQLSRNAGQHCVLVTPVNRDTIPSPGPILAPTSTFRDLTYPVSNGERTVRSNIAISLTQVNNETIKEEDWIQSPLTFKLGIWVKFRKLRPLVELEEGDEEEENMFAEIMRLNPFPDPRDKDKNEDPSQPICGSVVVVRCDGKPLSRKDVHALWDFIHAVLNANRVLEPVLLPIADRCKRDSLEARRARYEQDLYDIECVRGRSDRNYLKWQDRIEKANSKLAEIAARAQITDDECWVERREDMFETIQEQWVERQVDEPHFAVFWHDWKASAVNEGFEGYGALKCPVRDHMVVFDEPEDSKCVVQ